MIGTFLRGLCLCFGTILVLSGCASFPDPDRTGRGAEVVETARSLIGTPYQYGGRSPQTGFDCSGFAGYVFEKYGIKLPRSARDMAAFGHGVDRDQLRLGDLLLFDITGQGVSHVGIYTGRSHFIHSPSRGKAVEEITLWGHPYWEGRFRKARRVI